MLAGLQDDDEFQRAQGRELMRDAELSEARSTDNSSLLRVDRSDLSALLDKSTLKFDKRCALLYFLKLMKRSKWARWQKLYPARIGISLVAEWDHGRAMALCGLKNKRCQQSDYCPRCALINRGKPAAREYADVYTKASFWYAISPSFEIDPERAGLHFVTRKADKSKGIRKRTKHFKPYKGKAPGVPLSSDHVMADGESNAVRACFETVFALASELVRVGLAEGVFASRELAWHFLPVHITPHGHLLVNTRIPITPAIAKEILDCFERLYVRRPHAKCLYPDLHIERLCSQQEITRWVFYISKPMDYVTGYLRAVRAGEDIAALNLEIDSHVFQGGAVILAPNSPRRYGNLSCRTSSYIGAGSVTAFRKEQTERRKAERARLGLPQPEHQRETPPLIRAIERAAHLQQGEV
jgi:hypothetical protein